jgi:hypothetical protein
MPSVTSLWVQGIGLTVLAIALGSWRAWAALFPAALALLLFIAAWSDAHDPSIRDAVERELGPHYISMAYSAALLPLLVAIAVGGVRLIRRRSEGPTAYQIARAGAGSIKCKRERTSQWL